MTIVASIGRMAVAAAVFVAASGLALAGEFGTPEEAKAMLERAVEAVKTDKQAALEKFKTGADGFRDRDLYPFCGDTAGTFTAHINPALVGTSLKELKDKQGKALGEKIYAKAEEGKMAEVEYMWPRPGETEPVQKISYVTKVDDQICAVGYYK